MARIFANADFGATQRNLTFNGTKFNLNGVQNKAVFSSLNTLSNENLKQFSKIVSKNLDLNDIKTTSNVSKNYEFANEVSFVDKISGNTINLKLSNENLERLKTHFGSQNFDKDKNGQITLRGEAKNFVSGWFGDIAYKRNYVGADTDKNGFLNESEKGDTLAGYSSNTTYETNGANVSVVNFNGISSYLPYSRHYDAPIQNTIEKALNATLKADTNMDGYLNLGELQSKEQIIKYAKKTIENDPLGEPRVFVSLEEFLQKITQENQEMIKKRIDEQLKKQLESENYASADEYFNALEKELQNIQSLSMSFKISEETLIKNLNNPNFANDMHSLINEITQQVTNSLKIDISA